MSACRQRPTSWITPPHYLNAVVDAFGEIDLDPCAHLLSPVVAKRRIILPEDGLAASWDARLVYVNPPFSGLLKWINRAADAYERRESETIVMLSPVRTDSATWRDRIVGKTTVGLMNGRLKFEAPPGTKGNVTPFSLMTIIWEGRPTRWRCSPRRCHPHGSGKHGIGPCRRHSPPARGSWPSLIYSLIENA